MKTNRGRTFCCLVLAILAILRDYLLVTDRCIDNNLVNAIVYMSLSNCIVYKWKKLWCLCAVCLWSLLDSQPKRKQGCPTNVRVRRS